jgi:CBS domain-containing protein
MQVYEVMTPDAVVVGADMTLAEAAQRMKLLDVGPLPVVDGNRVVGVLTDRDITVRATSEGVDPTSVCVRDVMTAEVVACLESDDVAAAARMMQLTQLRRLVVVDDDGRMVGIVSLSDIALHTHDERLTAETLEGVLAPGDKRVS